MNLLPKKLRYEKTDLLPVCGWCHKPIEEEYFIDMRDYDASYRFHCDCVTDNENELLNQLWTDELEREFKVETKKYMEEYEESLEEWE
ncbi:MAG: hypothetical protein KBT27_08195 [Prevotellaceae bacterium]|nr:hypothetical protein [Candidatus Faecinaster equi]